MAAGLLAKLGAFEHDFTAELAPGPGEEVRERPALDVDGGRGGRDPVPGLAIARRLHALHRAVRRDRELLAGVPALNRTGVRLPLDAALAHAARARPIRRGELRTACRRGAGSPPASRRQDASRPAAPVPASTYNAPRSITSRSAEASRIRVSWSSRAEAMPGMEIPQRPSGLSRATRRPSAYGRRMPASSPAASCRGP